MEKISIFNYEAFYLDYLEGNLNEEDAALLLAFLEKHPDLNVDDELPALEVSEVTVLTENDKKDLKQVDASDTITHESIEFFLISSAEGLLSNEKQLELNAFIKKHPKYKREQNLYNAVFLKHHNEVYFGKEDLKRKTRVLWSYWTAAAAACAAGVYFLLQIATVDQLMQPFSENDTEKEINVPFEQKYNKQMPVIEYDNAPVIQASELTQEDYDQQAAANSPQDGTQKERHSIPSMRRKKAGPIHVAINNDIQPLSGQILPETPISNPQNDVAMLGYGGMTNPIEPITRRINERFNTNIDVRTARATEEKEGGFYIKIGKFEFMRKRTKKRSK